VKYEPQQAAMYQVSWGSQAHPNLRAKKKHKGFFFFNHEENSLKDTYRLQLIKKKPIYIYNAI